MAERFYASNDPQGGQGALEYNDEVFFWSQASETSALAASAVMVPLGPPMKSNGRVIDFWIGVAKRTTSASGFVSATIAATPRINSVAFAATDPAIVMAGSAGQAIRVATNAGGGVSAVISVSASALFSTGDQFAFDYNALSVGSAAAGAAGVGLRVGIRVRYHTR